MNKVDYNNMPLAIEQLIEKINNLEQLIKDDRIIKEDTSIQKYSLDEAASYCRMASPTFRTYVVKRKVAGIKFGKAWFFYRKDLDVFINDYRKPTIKELEKTALNTLTKT